MGGLSPSQCLLFVLILLVSATHGGVHPWRRENQDLRYQSYYGRGLSRQQQQQQHHSRTQGRLHNQRHLTRPATTFRQLLRETFPETALTAPFDLDPRLQEQLITNDLGMTAEDEVLYSARFPNINQVGGERSRHRQVEDNYQNHFEEVCPTVRKWDQLSETVDIDGNEVVIDNTLSRENQTYYTFQCLTPCAACKHVNGNSQCKMKYTYVKMYHHLKIEGSNGVPRWNFVEVPSHCSCELVPKGVKCDRH